MGPIAIVVIRPCYDDVLGLGSLRTRLVEVLVPQAAIEAHDERVLHGLAKRDVVPLDKVILLPLEGGV